MHAADVRFLLAAEAERVGGDRRSLARSAESGELVRVQRGVYVRASDWAALGEQGRHLLRMRALAGPGEQPVRFSHWSAAVAHDLPVPVKRLDRIHRTEPGGAAERTGVCTHPHSLAEPDLVDRYGLRVTAVPRTAVDIATIGTFREGVAMADAALRLLGREDEGRIALADAWRRAAPRRAVRKVERVLTFADGRAESVGESESRVTIVEPGLPAPVLQQDFFDGDGFVARVDFWWPDFGLVGEFDGRIKYFDDLLTRGDPARVVYEEKLREDRLRAIGPRVVRWGWVEAVSPARLGARLAAAGLRA